MERKTPLYDVHVEEGGKIVPFAGYLLPVQYGTGVIQEHMAVRQQAGLFDVSHMGEILFTGPTALDTINHLLTNDYNGMAVNKVRYGAMCNADGGTIDDLVVYKFGEERYLAVVNAANREKDYAHMAANVLPAEMHRLTALCLANDFSAAGRLQLKLKPLCDALFCEVNPIPVKTALNLMGLEAGELRLPLCPPTDASVERLKLALSSWDLLPEQTP